MAKRLHIVEQKFLETINENNLINAEDRIVVGVSGGPDSTTLLSCLNKYKQKYNYELIVTHVNHLIREDSTDDEQYVENMCQNLNIKFYKIRANVEEEAIKNKKSTEDMGRIIRYNFFNEVAKKEHANKIAIAHNMNDNAETLLLNLIRGTGLQGLEGMKPLEYNKYIRPLISCERKYIEDYCKVNNLNPRIDSTNSENIYNRNKIRNKLIPYLKQLNPNIVETLYRTTKIIQENNEFIENKSKLEYNKISIVENNCVKFKLQNFNILPTNIRKNLVLMAVEELQGNRKNIEKSNIDNIIKIAENNVGNKYINLNKNIQAKIENSYLNIYCCIL